MREEGEKPREEERERSGKRAGRETLYRKLVGTKISTVAEY